MRSVMTHTFSQVPKADIPRSTFARDHGYKTTFDAGYLIPVYVDEALPGDTINLQMSAFARLSTPLHPFMDNMFVDTFFFAVPIRLIWDNWQKFNGEQEDPGDSTDYLVPQMVAPAATGYANGSLSDYFGIPTGVAGLSHSAFWHRAYALIWNEWFEIRTCKNSTIVDKDDGPDDPAQYPLLKRGKRHDYFTSALPWPQKGPAVDLPLGTFAPVVTNNQAIRVKDGSNTESDMIYRSTGTSFGPQNTAPWANGEQTFFGSQTGLRADLSRLRLLRSISYAKRSKFNASTSAMREAVRATPKYSRLTSASPLRMHVCNDLSTWAAVARPSMSTLWLKPRLPMQLARKAISRLSAPLPLMVTAS